MRRAPKGFRLHIGLFGRRNVGKSSLLNALTHQAVSLVSEVAGTTTDPVEKPMELLPLGPVLFIDTAGIDDVGLLGQMRVERTRQVFDRTDLGVVVAVANRWGRYEDTLLSELQKRQTPTIVVFNKIDLSSPGSGEVEQLQQRGFACVQTQATRPETVLALRQALLQSAPPEWLQERPILGDLVGPGGMAVLVTPIDKEAPKGRLILPQVQAIRDLMDHDAMCLVVQDNRLREALEALKQPPKLVVTDSQAFKQVAGDTPDGVPLTSFSILFSRFKGDLLEQARGALLIGDLRPGDRVLIAEACTHHPIEDDIGTVKIPRWLQEVAGGKLKIENVRGHDFPADPSGYRLVIHCGACMWNRKEMLSRILHCQRAGVPITNYGLAIAYCLGILERALAPFPEARSVLNRLRQERGAARTTAGIP
jgi:[FeFe] hydrogenase H-cluster maturation GTPase HydF